ncbi:MAG: DUF3467 domain-containing protein [Anaerolineae bacterium]|nr:DUF3467 domain-containing protein [Anaerolineae bacterium]MDH7474883.1 DUF3467 domain-containing protein [Anaerolineae bacterium]
MANNQSVQPQKLNIELPADLEAVYSNLALITHSPSEVVIDFARILPNVPKAKIYARVLMTPMNAKLLHKALGDNLHKFEEQYGEIKTPDMSFHEERPLGFKK